MMIATLWLPLWLVACGTPSAVESPGDAQVVRDDDDPDPVIEKVQYAELDPDRTAILVTIAEGAAPDTLIWSFGGEDIELTDDGAEGDAARDDGTYTGVAESGLEPFRSARQSYSEELSGQDSLVGAQFSGHRVTALVELSSDFVDDIEVEEVTLDELGGVFEAVTAVPIATDADGVAALPPATHDPYRTLVITEPELMHNPDFTGSWQGDAVDCNQVGNHDGPAGFRHLMGQIANGLFTPDEFISEWMAANATVRTVNGTTISGGMGTYELYNGSTALSPLLPHPWPKLFDDGVAGTFNDIVDGTQTPVQLIAIVNRFDLAAGGYGGAGEAELRFVFTFIDEENCEPTNGTLILEYAVPLHSCGEVESWADLWDQLDAYDPTTQDYLDFLVNNIIEPVVSAGADPSRPNESNLKVLRTNEQVFIWPHYLSSFPSDSTRDWRMEEWAVDASTHLLANQVLAQTPGADWVDPDVGQPYPHPQDVDGYIDAFEIDILAGTHQVPLTYSGSVFASPEVRYGNFGQDPGPYNWIAWGAHPWRAMSWGSANVSSVEARQRFSLATCSGCHAGEVFEDADGVGQFNDSNWEPSVPGGQLEEPFRHVSPASPLQGAAHLSRFLTGTSSTCAPGWEFVTPLGPLAACAVDTCCPIGDPVFGHDDGQVHYNEFARRGGILQEVLINGCGALKTQSTSSVVASAH